MHLIKLFLCHLLKNIFLSLALVAKLTKEEKYKVNQATPFSEFDWVEITL